VKALATVLSVVLHGFRASMISAVLMATVGVACGPQTGVLRVSVRTDLVPGREVELYRVELFEDPPGPEAEASASLRRATPVGEEAGREQRVAEYVVPAGARTVRVRAIGPQGGTALERLAVVEVLPPVTQLTLTLTRDCVGVACPLADDDPALLTCLGGRCVDPRCSAETPEFCEAECLDGADCDLPPAACADALCQQGVCLEVGRPLACGSEAWCSPELGCVPVDGPPMPEPDAGLPLDAGTATPDAGLPGPEDAGAPEPEDAGAPESDAGAPPDAASPDAGAPPDAGAGPSPRPELAMWYRAGEPGPVHALFDSGFGAATATAAVDDWQIFAGAAHPTRDEVIAAGVTQSRHATAQRWDGVGWTPHPFNRLARARVADYWAVDVVYETLSQDALLVWNNGQTGTDGLSYTTWDGATWSAERSPTAPTAGEPQQLHLASSPLDDEAVLVASTGAADYAMVWDGSAWGDAVLLDTTEGDTDVQVATRRRAAGPSSCTAARPPRTRTTESGTASPGPRRPRSRRRWARPSGCGGALWPAIPAAIGSSSGPGPWTMDRPRTSGSASGTVRRGRPPRS
jgi:hypothetical protein